MSITIVDTLAEDVWQRFVDQHPHSNIFHTPAMQEVFARTRGYTPLLSAVLGDDGRIKALMTAVQIRLLPRPFVRATSRIVANGSVLNVNGQEGHTAVSRLLRWHNKHSGDKCLYTELRHRHDQRRLQPVFSENGYVHEEELNFLIQLDAPSEEIWQRLNRTARKNVRRGQKLGLVAEELTSVSEIGPFYDLLDQAYASAQVPLADVSLFEAAMTVLVPAGMARFVLAQSPDGIAGARALLIYKDVVLDWYAGANLDLRHMRPNDFLVWDTLQWGATHGYRSFDFGGAGHPDRPYGVREFKAKFGGELVNYGRARCVHSPPLLRLSEAAYSFLRRFV